MEGFGLGPLILLLIFGGSIVAGVALAIWWFVETVRAANRATRGRCIHCGYDLRASGRVCPECGAERSSHGHPAD